MKNKINLCVLFIGVTSSLSIQGAQPMPFVSGSRQLLHSVHPTTGFIEIREANTTQLVAELNPHSKPLFEEREPDNIGTYLRIAHKSNMLFCCIFCEMPTGGAFLRTDANFHPLANATEPYTIIVGYQLTGSGKATEFTPEQIAQIQHSYFTPNYPSSGASQLPFPFFLHSPLVPVMPMQTPLFADPYPAAMPNPAAMPVPFMAQPPQPVPVFPQPPVRPARPPRQTQQSIQRPAARPLQAPAPQTVQASPVQPAEPQPVGQATQALRAVLHAMQAPQAPSANTVENSSTPPTTGRVERILQRGEPDVVPSANTAQRVLEPSSAQQALKEKHETSLAHTRQPSLDLTLDKSTNNLPVAPSSHAPSSQRSRRKKAQPVVLNSVSEAEEDAAEKAKTEAARQEAEQQEAQRKAEALAKAEAAAQEQAAADKARKAAAEKAHQDALKAEKERRAAQAERDRQASAAARKAEEERIAAAAQKEEKTGGKKSASDTKKSKSQPSAQKPSKDKKQSQAKDDDDKILEAAMAQAAAAREKFAAATAAQKAERTSDKKARLLAARQQAAAAAESFPDLDPSGGAQLVDAGNFFAPITPKEEAEFLNHSIHIFIQNGEYEKAQELLTKLKPLDCLRHTVYSMDIFTSAAHLLSPQEITELKEQAIKFVGEQRVVAWDKCILFYGLALMEPDLKKKKKLLENSTDYGEHPLAEGLLWQIKVDEHNAHTPHCTGAQRTCPHRGAMAYVFNKFTRSEYFASAVVLHATLCLSACAEMKRQIPNPDQAMSGAYERARLVMDYDQAALDTIHAVLPRHIVAAHRAAQH